MPRKPDTIDAYARAGGPVPSIGPIGESFWAGYQDRKGTRMGVAGSVQRRAYNAGKARAKAEPGLSIPANR